MSDQKRYASPGGLPLPSASSLNPGSPSLSSPMANEGPPSEVNPFEKKAYEHCSVEARPASVQPMPKEGVQGMSPSPVQPMSRLAPSYP